VFDEWWKTKLWEDYLSVSNGRHFLRVACQDTWRAATDNIIKILKENGFDDAVKIILLNR